MTVLDGSSRNNWLNQPGSNLDQPAIAAIATTRQGLKTLQRLGGELAPTIWLPVGLQISQAEAASLQAAPIKTYTGPLRDHIQRLWPTQQAWIFCLATGAVVRLIAPLLDRKQSDPAVIVVDPAGQWVISLAGGHQQGADRLTRQIALHLQAQPILTGGAAALDFIGIDQLGRPFGWQPGPGDWTAVSAAIARQEPVTTYQDAGSTQWQPLAPMLQTEVSAAAAEVVITAKEPHAYPKPQSGQLSRVFWHPRVLWIGVGCERGSSQRLIEFAVQTTLEKSHLTAAAIAGLASLDLKADEPGLLALSEVKQWPLQCFTSGELNTVAVPNPSAVVAQAVGTASVAEAAALLAATRHCDRWASLQTADKPSLIAPKQVYRLDTEPGAVTVAIAQAPLEYLPTTGHIDLIGTGPGAIEQITPAAQAAIARADVVLGYSLYLDLIQPLLHGEQIIEHWVITAEQARAERALDLAEWGLRVALVSSGDCGIYGMAGLALECLTQRGWAGGRPTVQVHPGISAVQAAAAQVGAPLMHDFCTISLSDLLTPWPTIERRLVAAAQADFVVALYNPKSKNRSHQIEQAQQILLTYRNPETPVALVRSVYRLEQQIILTTLENFLHHPIDMVTVVLIGNQSTRQHGQWLITPRGYLGFTDNAKH